MKILLVNAIDERDVIDAPHLGLGYIAAYARDHGGYTDIKIVESRIFQTLEEYKPDVIGITSVSQNYDIAKAIAKRAKELGAATIVGGVHITLLPLSLDKNIDIAVLSEGEIAFLKIIQTVEKYGLDKEKLAEIKGVVYWDNGQLRFTQNGELVPDVDTLPYPARDLIDYDWVIATMFTSRGCPFNCVFCSSTRIWEKVRYHSPEYVVNEIRHMVETYGTKHITFNDDLFIANPKRAIQIADLIAKEGLNEKVTFNMSCRANLVTDEVAIALKKMNTELVSMGLESGSPTILKFAKGPNITVEDNMRAIDILKKYGVMTHGTFIIGFPMDTKETVLETLNFIKKSKLDSFEAYILAPMPGTPVWDYALQKGFVSEDMEWSRIAHRNEYDFMEKIVLAENLTKQEMFELYNKFVAERKKRKFVHIMRNAIKHPYRIPHYIKSRIMPREHEMIKVRTVH